MRPWDAKATRLAVALPRGGIATHQRCAHGLPEVKHDLLAALGVGVLTHRSDPALRRGTGAPSSLINDWDESGGGRMGRVASVFLSLTLPRGAALCLARVAAMRCGDPGTGRASRKSQR